MRAMAACFISSWAEKIMPLITVSAMVRQYFWPEKGRIKVIYGNMLKKRSITIFIKVLMI